MNEKQARITPKTSPRSRPAHSRVSPGAAVGLLAALLVIISAPSSLNPPAVKNDRLAVGHTASDEAAPGEDVDGRNNWFLSQRAYPDETVPADARRRAWEASNRVRLESSVEAAAAQTWKPIGPAPTTSIYSANWGATSGRINAIAVSPANSRVVLVGSSTGGIWRSSDGGASFDPVSDDHVDLAVGSIAFSKSNPSIAYAGMGDTKLGYLGSGVLKSTNGGQTWRRASNETLPSPGSISKLEIDPTNPDRVFAAQYLKLESEKVTSAGLYLSTDGGVGWKKVLAGAGRDVTIDPKNPSVVYAGMSRVEKDTDPPAGLYRSTDGGATWGRPFTVEYELKKRRDVKVAISPVDTRIVYFYFGGFLGDYPDVQLKVSTDGGATWADRNTGLFDTTQFGYNTYIVADPAKAETVFIGSRDLFKSTDAGLSWTNLTGTFTNFGSFYDYTPTLSKTHPDQHSLAFSPSDARQFYVGNDGGISKTTDGGGSFQSLNRTLSLTQFIGISLHPTDPTITVGGTQDNGTQLRAGASDQWFEIYSGDGGRTVINPVDPSMVFITYYQGIIFRYTNNGRQFDAQVATGGNFLELPVNPRIAFYPPFTGNGVDATLYLGTWRLFTSTDLGNSWRPTAGEMDLTKGVNDKGRDVLTAIGVGRANKDIIYTGSGQGRAMVSTDGGVSWKDTASLPDRFITSITVDGSNSSVAYLTLSGFKTGHVFKTTDTGATWKDISGNLPDIPTSALLIDPIDSNTLYAGTDVGVFRSTSGGADWESFNRGMPPVVVHDFAAQPTGLIQVATYGRGAYELTGSQRPFVSSATFDGKKQLVIAGSGFGDAPRVFINGVERTGLIRSSSDGSIKLVGKAKKLGLKAGANLIKVLNDADAASNEFTLKL